MLTTTFRYGVSALLAVFALLQINDPDPAVWMLVYGLAAFCVAAPSRRGLVNGLSWLTGGMILTLALISLPGVWSYLGSGEPGTIFGEMSPDRPYIEPAREFLGVLIAGAALVGFRFRTAPGKSGS